MLISTLGTLDYVIIGIPRGFDTSRHGIGANRVLLSWPPRLLLAFWLAPLMGMALILALYTAGVRMLRRR